MKRAQHQRLRMWTCRAPRVSWDVLFCLRTRPAASARLQSHVAPRAPSPICADSRSASTAAGWWALSYGVTFIGTADDDAGAGKDARITDGVKGWEAGWWGVDWLQAVRRVAARRTSRRWGMVRPLVMCEIRFDWTRGEGKGSRQRSVFGDWRCMKKNNRRRAAVMGGIEVM